MGRSENGTRIITFYSFKGGVGRTMAMANAACQLANRHGLDVIAVDWDLEAPGLHYYFGYDDEDLKRKKGLIDYLEDFAAQVAKGKSGRTPTLSKYLVDLKPELAKKIKFGSVRLMTCGRTDKNYMSRVQRFDWNRFYAEQSGFRVIEKLKQQLKNAADLTLVDARAGQADIGATPTIQVPDAVVLLFTSNRQSLEGSAGVARRLKDHPERQRQELAPLKLLMVPSRVFPEKEAYDDWMASDAEPLFRSLLEEGVIDRDNQPEGLRQCVLATEPDFTFGETLPVLEEDTPSDALRSAYFALAAALADLRAGRRPWSRQRDLPGAADDELALREQLQRALDRNDDHGAARLKHLIAQVCIVAGRFDEALELLERSLAQYDKSGAEATAAVAKFDKARALLGKGHFDAAWDLCQESLRYLEGTDQIRSRGVIFQEMGVVRGRQNRNDEAWDLYQRALELYEHADEVRDQGSTFQDMGKIRVRQDRLDEAWDLYQRALELYERVDEVRGQGIIITEMGKVRHQQDHPDEAWDLYQRALELNERAGDIREQGVTFVAMGQARHKEDRLDEAWNLYQRALELFEHAGGARDHGVTLLNMGRLAIKLGDTQLARSFLGKASRFLEEAGDDELLAEARAEIDALGRGGKGKAAKAKRKPATSRKKKR